MHIISVSGYLPSFVWSSLFLLHSDHPFSGPNPLAVASSSRLRLATRLSSEFFRFQKLNLPGYRMKKMLNNSVPIPGRRTTSSLSESRTKFLEILVKILFRKSFSPLKQEDSGQCHWDWWAWGGEVIYIWLSVLLQPRWRETRINMCFFSKNWIGWKIWWKNNTKR